MQDILSAQAEALAGDAPFEIAEIPHSKPERRLK